MTLTLQMVSVHQSYISTLPVVICFQGRDMFKRFMKEVIQHVIDDVTIHSTGGWPEVAFIREEVEINPKKNRRPT